MKAKHALVQNKNQNYAERARGSRARPAEADSGGGLAGGAGQSATPPAARRRWRRGPQVPGEGRKVSTPAGYASRPPRARW
jgi:hypothetical protein